MTETRVWQGDRHAESWTVTSDGAVVDLTGATVRLVADPRTVGGSTVELACSVAAGVVTHELDGTLPIGRYDLVAKVTRLGKTVTYPDAGSGPVRLVVSAAVGQVPD